MPQLFQRRDMLSHNRYFAGAVINILDAYRAGAACIDRTLVVLDRDELAFVIEHRPVFLQ